jgi:hypothetical protein
MATCCQDWLLLQAWTRTQRLGGGGWREDGEGWREKGGWRRGQVVDSWERGRARQIISTEQQPRTRLGRRRALVACLLGLHRRTGRKRRAIGKRFRGSLLGFGWWHSQVNSLIDLSDNDSGGRERRSEVGGAPLRSLHENELALAQLHSTWLVDFMCLGQLRLLHQ